jgi:uncharacterized RDD family membrane protein YckC
MAVAAWGPATVTTRAALARLARARRFLALVLDIFLYSLVAIVVNAVYGVNYSGPVSTVGWPALCLLWMAYYIIPEAIFGASPGKMFTGLCVVRLDGRPLEVVSIVSRNLLRFIDALPGLYLVGGLLVLLIGSSQRLGDLLAGTTVVDRAYAIEPHATRRPTASTRRIFGIALLAALLFTVAFDYFARPAIVLQNLYAQHQLMAPDLSSYTLGSPHWELGRVTYPLTGYSGARACTGSISLEWSWPLGWTMTDGTLECPPPI